MVKNGLVVSCFPNLKRSTIAYRLILEKLHGVMAMGEQESTEIRRRLKGLGRKKSSKTKTGERKFTPKDLPNGEVIDSSHGSAYRIEAQYLLDHQHGDHKLSEVLSFTSNLAAEVARQPNLVDAPLENLLFLDTETTGLSGGAGTLVFLVGIGQFVGDQFRLRQYFLRDPTEEAGMLHVLKGDIEQAAGFVTFNGGTFDLPLLESRYTIALRKRMLLVSSPHMDLLHVSRRLWKQQLPDCTLGTVENSILGVRRTDADVPGSWIPGMYLDYLRTGDASEMARVIYHNTIDILSLVSLAGVVLERHNQSDFSSLTEYEALAIARWHQERGRSAPAESAFKYAAKTSEDDLRIEALRRFTTFLKRDGRKHEAVDGWIKWSELAPEDPQPCIELAKYYEWDQKDYAQARHWAQTAVQCLTFWPEDWRRDRFWTELEHRLQRLQGKIG